MSRVYTGDWPARLWGWFPGATSVQLRQHQLSLPENQALQSPLRVGFASDLHLGPTTPPKTLERGFEHLASARLDVLILGGDYVFLEATRPRVDALCSLVSSVPARHKIAVMGNHDLWTHHTIIERALEGIGVRVLINDAVHLDGAHEGVAVVGLDDPWTGHPDGEQAFQTVRDAQVVIVACHSPAGLLQARGRKAALYLAGHTHGGHIALPGNRPVILPGGPFSWQFPYGLFRDGETAVYVSRGLGGIEVPVRTYAPPDVAVFTLS